MKISWQAPTTKICARCCREERESTGKPIPGPKGLNMKEQANWSMSVDWEVDENTWMNKIQTSVLVNMDINYAPNDYNTFRPIEGRTGAPPTEIDMKLDFQETQIITKAEVLEGF